MKHLILLMSGSLAMVAVQPAEARPLALSGPQILKALTGAAVQGKGWTQRFLAGGQTIYEEGGRTSEGRWDVRGDEYCSQWPPSDQWSCYAVTLDEAVTPPTIVWRDGQGEGAVAQLIRESK